MVKEKVYWREKGEHRQRQGHLEEFRMKMALSQVRSRDRDARKVRGR